VNAQSALNHLCGVFWMLTYVLAIFRGMRDRSYGVPAIAVTMNVAWELYDSMYALQSIALRQRRS